MPLTKTAGVNKAVTFCSCFAVFKPGGHAEVLRIHPVQTLPDGLPTDRMSRHRQRRKQGAQLAGSGHTGQFT